MHTDVQGETDLQLDPNVRIYLVAGAQHLGGGPPDRGICQNPRNILDDRPPILRAMLAMLHGSYLPFPRTPEERRRSGDPRRCVLERYPTRAVYVARMTEAALQLQQEGFLLEEDVVRILNVAASRRLWDDQQ